MPGQKVNKTYRGVIKDWQLHHLSVTHEQLKTIAIEKDEELMLPLIITGTVKSDPTNRFEVGWHMKTSQLTFFDEENGYCETRKSIYKLEGPNGQDIFPDLGDGVRGIFY